MSIDKARVPQKEQVIAVARRLMTELQAKMAAEMDEIAKNTSLPKTEVDKQIYTILDGYQTAFISMTGYLHDLRHKTGARAQMIANIDTSSYAPPVDADGTIN